MWLNKKVYQCTLCNFTFVLSSSSLFFVAYQRRRSMWREGERKKKRKRKSLALKGRYSKCIGSVAKKRREIYNKAMSDISLKEKKKKLFFRWRRKSFFLFSLSVDFANEEEKKTMFVIANEGAKNLSPFLCCLVPIRSVFFYPCIMVINKGWIWYFYNSRVAYEDFPHCK